MRWLPAILTLALALGACAAPPADSVVAAKPYVEVSAETRRLSCEGPGDSFGSRLARSPALLAPGGHHRAYAQVKATATEWKDGARDCRNVSTLHLAARGENFRVAFQQNPGAEGQTGNSLELIDWSPSGDLLLMELLLWIYPTDVVNPLILVYETASGMVRQLPVEELLRKKYLGDCAIALRAAGFTAEGAVVVESTPPHGQLASPPCTTDHVLWLFDAKTQSIEALPKAYRVMRHATSRG